MGRCVESTNRAVMVSGVSEFGGLGSGNREVSFISSLSKGAMR